MQSQKRRQGAYLYKGQCKKQTHKHQLHCTGPDWQILRLLLFSNLPFHLLQTEPTELSLTFHITFHRTRAELSAHKFNHIYFPYITHRPFLHLNTFKCAVLHVIPLLFIAINYFVKDKIYTSSCSTQETWSYFTAHIGREPFLLLIRYMTTWGIRHRWNTITYILVNTCPVLLTIRTLLLFPSFPFHPPFLN